MKQAMQGVTNKIMAQMQEMAQKASISGISAPEYECSECEDTGFAYITKNGHRYATPCRCYEWRQLRKHKANSNIEARFEQCSLENYETWNESARIAKRKALAYVESFRNGDRSSIAFLGNVGAGKTHLGIGILQTLMSGKIAVLYAPYREMITRLKSNVLDEEAYYRCLGRYANVNVLFIDDLYKGVAFGNNVPTDLKYVYDVINERYIAKRPTLITSEYDPAQLCSADEAIGSRILEMCDENIHVFQGNNENYRLRNLVK